MANIVDYSKYYDRLSSKGYIKPSYWHEPSTTPLLPLTIGQLVEWAADTWEDEEALVSVHENVRWTFRDIGNKTEVLAASFLELGLKPGDVLAVWGFNSSKYYLSSLAARRAGLIVAGVDPCAQAPELLHCITKVGAKGIVAVELNEKQKYYEIIRSLAPELSSCEAGMLNSAQLPELKVVLISSKSKYPGTFNFEDAPAMASPSSLQRVSALRTLIESDDPTGIHYTSGTTGKSKAVLLNHRALVNNSYICGKLLGLNLRRRRFLSQMQLCHISCNVLAVFGGLHFGGTTVFSSGEFDVESAIQTLQNERCSLVFGAPAIFVDIVSNVRRNNIKLDYPELAYTGGAPITEKLIAEVYKTLPIKTFTILYGMTECLMVTQTRADDSMDKLSTVGRVTDHIEVKIVDDKGKTVPMGSPGELWTRGYNVMNLYWNDEEKTAESITQDGWFKTGDRFILEEGGYLKIVGRVKEIIIRGAFNIYPKEIENFFNSHPAVIDVQAFGVPDARMGEEMCVYIRQKEGGNLTEESVKTYCVGKLADFRIPRYVRFIDEFPKNTTGKIDKKKLREIFLKDEEYVKINKDINDKLYG